jgi:hypothetical protein
MKTVPCDSYNRVYQNVILYKNHRGYKTSFCITLRKRLLHPLYYSLAAERRHLAGLDDHRVAGYQCGDHEKRNLAHRKVPRRDYRHHADGSAEDLGLELA